MITRARWLALVALAAISCSGRENDSAARQPLADAVAPLRPYETVTLHTMGRIEGTVTWEGPAPRPTSLALPDSIARVCRTSSLLVTPIRVVRGGVAESIVWLDGIRQGKSLPASRRFEIATDRCRLTPSVQPAIAGGMLNVLSLDRLVHRLQFTRPGNEGTLARVEQFDAGQVVPLETVLRLPGPISVQSDRFSWMVAWIQVFDHPYFAMTSNGGAFAIDSVPPGDYTFRIWHPVTGQRDTTISVAGGDTVRVHLALRGNEA